MPDMRMYDGGIDKLCCNILKKKPRQIPQVRRINAEVAMKAGIETILTYVHYIL